MSNQSKKSILYITCPNCLGSGLSNGRHCSVCHSFSVVAWSGNRFYFWDRILDDAHIFHRRMTHRVYRALDFGLVIFGLAGVLSLAYEFFTTVSLDNVSGLLFWQNQSIPLLIFWLSLITDTYAISRLSRQLDLMARVPKYVLPTESTTTSPRWTDFQAAQPAQKFEISRVFSGTAHEVLEKAWDFAGRTQDAQVTHWHILAALLTYPEISIILTRLGTPFNLLYQKLKNAMAGLERQATRPRKLSPEAYQALYEAFFYAAQTGEDKVQLSDLLIGCIRASETLQDILYDLKIDDHKIVNVAIWMKLQKELIRKVRRMNSYGSLRPRSGMNRSMTSVATPYLDSFSEDLTMLARNGYLEACIGREKEIRQVFSVLEAGNRQSVVLVGQPGVGRRTIVYGLAQRMLAEDVPPLLSDKRLVSLSVASLLSGVTASEAEQRLLIVIHEIVRAGNIILFIHDVAHLTGITAGNSGSLDLAGALAEVLNKKLAVIIATAEPDQYTEFIERGVLGQVFERIDVNEVEGDEAIRILEGKSSIIEFKHQVQFSYDAIEKSVEFSNRYIHERVLPEKALEILEETAARVASIRGKNTQVTDNDVSATVSDKTKIPLTEITQAESEKLLHLEDRIHERMINQNEAVNMVASALRRARAEIRDFSRPIANLLFLGPTGVGKTQLAKTVSDVYFGREHQMIRLDMSEYQEKSSLDRLIGAGQGREASTGYLTEGVRHNPFSLVLFDEIEKAHPDILNLFLQVLDDGRLTDAQGRTIDFTNTIIICTSNACTDLIQELGRNGKSAQDIKAQLLEGELQRHFRSEFLNRFDGIIIFKALTQEHIFAVAQLMLKDVAVNLEKKGIGFKATQEAVAELVRLGYDPQFGARPMRRVIQEKVDDIIATYMLSGKVGRRDVIVLDSGGKIDIIKSKKY